jgi:3beta-hydroxy-delta5-steroid dehydrogenase/steroid delta-isomerase
MTSHSNLGLCLVTGAAGYTGSHLVKALLDEGYTVRALIRSTPLNLQHKNLEQLRGDIRDAQQMLQACEGVGTVFHTAAMIATLGGSAVSKAYRDSARAVNVLGTVNIITACQAMGVSRLVHTSSVDTCFAGEENLHMDEQITPYANDYKVVYSQTKIEAEKAVLAANGVGGLVTCALRPDGIWGPGGSLMMDMLVEQLRSGKMVSRIGGDGALHDHVHIDNLVHAHLLAANALRPGSPVCGKAYFVSDGEPARLFQFVRPLFEGLGYKVPTKSIPAAPLRAVLTAWQWLHFKTGIAEPFISPHELNKATISHVVSSAAAVRDFAYQPIKTVALGMSETVAYYQKQ